MLQEKKVEDKKNADAINAVSSLITIFMSVYSLYLPFQSPFDGVANIIF